MPGHMDKGTKNYRNMMKRMEGMDMGGPMSDRERDLLSQMTDIANPMVRGGGSGSTSDAELKAFQDAVKGSAMAGIGGSVSDAEMELLSDTFGSNLTDLIRNAFEGLRNMGVSTEDAIRVLMMENNDMMMPQMKTDTMTEGALGSLPERPMMRPKQMPERLDADRTQSMDMQKTGMGT